MKIIDSFRTKRKSFGEELSNSNQFYFKTQKLNSDLVLKLHLQCQRFPYYLDQLLDQSFSQASSMRSDRSLILQQRRWRDGNVQT